MKASLLKSFLKDKKKLAIVAIGLVAVTGLALWLGGYIAQADTEPSYRFAKIDRGEIVATVSATGTIDAVKKVEIGSEVSGRIDKILVDFNSVVTKGQVLAELDQDSFRTRVDQARANLQATQAGLGDAKAGIERAQAGIRSAEAGLKSASTSIIRAEIELREKTNQKQRAVDLYNQGLLTLNERDTAVANFEQAQAAVLQAQDQKETASAQVENAKAQLATARASYDSAMARHAQNKAALEQVQVDLSRTIIRAPIDGIVVSRDMDVGQTVAASFSAPKLFVIANDLSRMIVTANVDEADIGRVKEGLKARFTVDAFPNQSFEGVVSQVRLAPILTQNVVTYNVIIDVANPGARLKPGMTANSTIEIDRRDNVLRVSSSALRYRPAKMTDEAQKIVDAAGTGGRGGTDRAGGGQGRPAGGDGAARQGGAGGGPGGGGGQGGGGGFANLTPEQRAERMRQFRAGGGGGGPRFVWIMKDKKPFPIRVRTGASDDSRTELVRGEGIAEGMEVLVSEFVEQARTPTPTGSTPNPLGGGGGRGMPGGRRGG